MLTRNEKEIKYVDMTPDVKSDTFVNDDYRGAILSNIGCYVASKHKLRLRERAKERLVQDNK